MSKSQIKIIIVAFIVVSVFLLFVLLVYRPAKDKVKLIKAELSSLNSQIVYIEGLIGKDKPLHVGIELLQEKLQELEYKFPQKEEETLKQLSDLARKLNIEVITTSPQPKKDFLDENNKMKKIEGKVFRTVVVGLKIQCFYKDLVKYVESLKKDISTFVSIEKLKIDKSASGGSKLGVTLQINLYILS